MRKLAYLAILTVIATFIYLFVINDNDGNNEVVENPSTVTDSKPIKAGEKPQEKAEKKPLLERIESSLTSDEVDQLCEELDTIARERRKLKPHEIQRLLDIIKQDRPTGGQREISADSWELLMNSSLNAITSSIDPESENNLSTTLAHLARNSSDPVIKLYALQHIAFWFPREPIEEHRQLLLTVLKESSQDIQETAGTALTVLSDLEKAELTSEEMASDNKGISKAALKITNNPKASTSVRVSAVHTLCDRNHKESLSSLKVIALNENEPVLLRKAAIFGIGKLGSEEDIEFLKSLPTINPRIDAAVKPAIQKLSK